MATKFVQNIVYILFFALLMVFIPLASSFAQNNTLTPSESVDVLEGSTTTEEAIVAEAVPIVPWYKLEKLTGDNINQGDFVVGPGRAEIEVKPGQTVVYEMSVANRISDGRQFKLEVEDISGTNDASQAVIFLGDQRGPYTVKDYISFPENNFTLNLGDRARIPVTISVPPDAEPGGYYGGVLVSTVKDDGTSGPAGTTRSPIVARIGTLFFITVPGKTEYAGATKEITLTDKSAWYEKGPIKLNVLFDNTGSVHLNPYGELRVENIFGEEVGFLELEPWFVLPKSLRTRDISWDRELLLGRYVATAYINRGYDDIIDEVSVTFWVLPWKIVGGIFLAIFIVLFSFRTFFRRFEFKRK